MMLSSQAPSWWLQRWQQDIFVVGKIYPDPFLREGGLTGTILWGQIFQKMGHLGSRYIRSLEDFGS